MPKRLTKEEFIKRSIEVHDDFYDYSKVEYINNSTKVCIICPKHGEFWQRPSDHINHHGCFLCKIQNQKSLIFGVGINDTNDIVISNNTKDICYQHWYDMIRRCYDPKSLSRNPTYKGCYVCEEWNKFSNFKKWFDDNYVEGWQLDKDILIKGNKVYSPETCCFIPKVINLLLNKKQNSRGDYPIGVSKRLDKYTSCVSCFGVRKYLGIYDSIEDAFNAYKCEREKYIKEIALIFKSKIPTKVYNALINYEVEITD